MGSNNILSVRRITRIAIFATILFVQEELLTMIPQVQLTQVLIAVFFYGFGFVDTTIIIIIHVLLDSLIMGGPNIIYTPVMILGWFLLPLILLLFRKIKNKYLIGIVVFVHAFLYSWIFAIATSYVKKIPLKIYLISDIPFEIALAINGLITTILLFKPLTNTINRQLNR